MDESTTLLERPTRKLFRWFVVCAALICVLVVIYIWIHKSNNANDDNWDFLLFTQCYPIALCQSLLGDRQHRNETCHFASDKHAWTIHGIWPTKPNEMGPYYCTRTVFNGTILEPILPNLKEHWPSIKENDDYYFWKHEWQKHGSCAVELPVFDSELTYFKQGLEWNTKYNVTDILSSNGIVPSDSKKYSYSDFSNAIVNKLNVTAVISCIKDVENEVYVISDIRLCISKTFDLVDCDKLEHKNKNCLENPLYYPDTVNFSLP